MANPKKPLTPASKQCPTCRLFFRPRPNQGQASWAKQECCSRSCAKTKPYSGGTKVCENPECGREFARPPGRYAAHWNQTKYCSNGCKEAASKSKRDYRAEHERQKHLYETGSLRPAPTFEELPAVWQAYRYEDVPLKASGDEPKFYPHRTEVMRGSSMAWA